MQIKDGDKVRECYLVDEGTLDTVIQIDGQTFRFNPEYAADYRDKHGVMTAPGFRRLCKECFDDMEDES